MADEHLIALLEEVMKERSEDEANFTAAVKDWEVGDSGGSRYMVDDVTFTFIPRGIEIYMEHTVRVGSFHTCVHEHIREWEKFDSSLDWDMHSGKLSQYIFEQTANLLAAVKSGRERRNFEVERRAVLQAARIAGIKDRFEIKD